MPFQASRLIVILRQEFVTYPGLLAKIAEFPLLAIGCYNHQSMAWSLLLIFESIKFAGK
jgi:hypothetical protein